MSNTIQIHEFRAHCSKIGDIMTNDKSGKGPGETCKTLLKDWLKEKVYGKRKEFESKHTRKGNAMEAEAIAFAGRTYNWLEGAAKNETLFANAFIKGTPDIILPESVEDVKCSWDCFTYPLFKDAPDKDYVWQLRGYMALTGRKSAGVVYALLNAPEDVIETEAFRACYKMGLDYLDSIIEDEVREKLTYSGIAESLRIKRFGIDWDTEQIALVYERVIWCRQYLREQADIITEQTGIKIEFTPNTYFNTL